MDQDPSCLFCGEAHSSESCPNAPAGPPPAGFRGGRPPFEHQSGFSGLLRTLILVMFSPRIFFAHLSREPRVFESDDAKNSQSSPQAERFAILCALLGFVAAALWNFTLFASEAGFIELASSSPALVEMMGQKDNFGAFAHIMRGRALFHLFCAPLLAFVIVHVVAGPVHLATRAFSKSPKPYAMSFRFVAYALAPLCLGLIPQLYIPAAFFALVIVCVAMRSLHQISIPGVIFGVFLPIVSLALIWESAVTPVVSPLVADVFLGPTKDARSEVKTSKDDEPLPPLPDPNRSHLVDVQAQIIGQSERHFSERFYEPGNRRMRIVHEVEELQERIKMCVRVEHKKGDAYRNVFIEVPLDIPLQSRTLLIDDEAFSLSPDINKPWAVREQLALGETFSLCFFLEKQTPFAPVALLQHGPTVGRYQ